MDMKDIVFQILEENGIYIPEEYLSIVSYFLSGKQNGMYRFFFVQTITYVPTKALLIYIFSGTSNRGCASNAPL